jgi:YD repeat-containing protein
MTNFKFIRGRDGNVIGSTIENTDTGITTARDRQGNVLGVGDSKRQQTRDKSGNLLRWTDDAGSLIEDDR